MTDLTPTLSQLVSSKHGPTIPSQKALRPSTETADEFLKEAYRINSHIQSLLQYLQSIRHAYLTTTAPQRRNQTTTRQAHSPPPTSQHLTEPERDAVDSSTALLLRDLAASISNLASAETLRQDTEATILRKRYGHSAAGALLFRWAGGGGPGDNEDAQGKSAEQVQAEESAKVLRTVRESVLWRLRRGLEGAASVQRGMVEKRIDRVREKEKSVLYKAAGKAAASKSGSGTAQGGSERQSGYNEKPASLPTPDAVHLSEADTARIEAQLSPEQLQLFAEENDTMLRHYEDTLSKVQNAEKSLIEISSLQSTLVSHLSTQEEYISQLVSDADTTNTNVGRGNKELKRATERRSTAQAVFWGTVGLCTWLVVWDLVF
ncbi:SNARE-complex protein Syntaxin-18 N-terminal [Penicillium longicatenatum]|uniref:SNARE-complex protein Syntaxin-18 N-terminal n=1 Tax=Penicillium longicatenatum TaxID=1561947 RepID=UPI002546F751|nr:SNARE-complex protein Syntaxin-18 N-terminal [Penicillium longicatenatum]KAJ5635120.1 SNARE-complex protein Syntaxin-18 N-terminal [Penicillium longicatenatum]